MTNERSPSDEVPCMRLDAPNRGFDRSRYTVLKNDPDVAWAIRDVLRLLRGEHVGHTSITSADPDSAERMGRVFADWFEGKGSEHKRYFVLRYDCPDGAPADPTARRALAHYADLTKDVNAAFADELQGELIRTEPRVMADRDNEPTERTHTDALQAVDAAAEMIEQQELDRDAAFVREIAAVINRYSRENVSDTPDFVLAEFLVNCLHSFEQGIASRRAFYGEVTTPGRTGIQRLKQFRELSQTDAPDPSPAPQRAVPPVDPSSLPAPKRKD